MKFQEKNATIPKRSAPGLSDGFVGHSTAFPAPAAARQGYCGCRLRPKAESERLVFWYVSFMKHHLGSVKAFPALPPISSATRPTTAAGRRAVAGRPGGGGCRA